MIPEYFNLKTLEKGKVYALVEEAESQELPIDAKFEQFIFKEIYVLDYYIDKNTSQVYIRLTQSPNEVLDKYESKNLVISFMKYVKHQILKK